MSNTVSWIHSPQNYHELVAVSNAHWNDRIVGGVIRVTEPRELLKQWVHSCCHHSPAISDIRVLVGEDQGVLLCDPVHLVWTRVSGYRTLDLHILQLSRISRCEWVRTRAASVVMWSGTSCSGLRVKIPDLLPNTRLSQTSDISNLRYQSVIGIGPSD